MQELRHKGHNRLLHLGEHYIYFCLSHIVVEACWSPIVVDKMELMPVSETEMEMELRHDTQWNRIRQAASYMPWNAFFCHKFATITNFPSNMLMWVMEAGRLGVSIPFLGCKHTNVLFARIQTQILGQKPKLKVVKTNPNMYLILSCWRLLRHQSDDQGLLGNNRSES
jgi:hypothetical protein